MRKKVYLIEVDHKPKDIQSFVEEKVREDFSDAVNFSKAEFSNDPYRIKVEFDLKQNTNNYG